MTNILDWAKVPVNTKVIVSDKNGNKAKRYFAFYAPKSDLPFFVFPEGDTSETYVYESGRWDRGTDNYIIGNTIDCFYNCELDND